MHRRLPILMLVVLGCVACSSPLPMPTTPTTPEAVGTPGATPTSPREDSPEQRLRQAAAENDLASATALIADGADVNAKDETQQSAYLLAASEGASDVLDLTLRSGAQVDDLDSWNGTALIRAAERGHTQNVGLLLRAGIDRNHMNRIGYQAIHEAVWLGKDDDAHVETVLALIAGGVQLDRTSETERLTPLQMARERGHARQLAALSSAQEPLAGNATEHLIAAAADGDAVTVARTLRAGADIEARDEKQRTALLLAVTGDHVEVARLLVAMGADPDALDAQHDTPWLVTGVTGSVAMLEALLPAHPDLTIVNRYGGVSVIPASERGHVQYVRRVVQTGIDVNHVNRLGWTALLEAVILGDGGARHQEIVRILLAAKADPAIADKDGVTALEHARAKGYTQIAAILEAAR